MSKQIHGLVVGMCLMGVSVGELRADLAPGPTPILKVLPSPGCPMPALKAAVAAQLSEVQGCMRRSSSKGKSVLHCSLNAKGQATACTKSPDGKNPIANQDLACIAKALQQLKVRVPASGAESLASCEAHIEVTLAPTPYRRPGGRGKDSLVPEF